MNYSANVLTQDIPLANGFICLQIYVY